MTEVPAGTAAPEAPATPAPGAQPVTAPDAPTVQENATPSGDESVQTPKTYTDEQVRKITSDRLAKERRRLERTVRAEVERDYLRQQIESGRSREEPSRRGEAAAEEREPDPKDFKDYASYDRAIARWEARQEIRETLKREEESRKSRDADQQSQAQIARDRAVLMKGAKEFRDFEEVVFNEEAPVTLPMMRAVLESDIPSKLAYYLASPENFEEAMKIAELPSTRQAAKVHELATKLAAPQTTKAPPPIVPNAGNAATKKDWPQMTLEEHVKAWAKRKR